MRSVQSTSGWNDQCIGECNEIKHFFAAMPRMVAQMFPGFDRDRVFALGFSAGAGGVSRALCGGSKGYDASPYGVWPYLGCGSGRSGANSRLLLLPPALNPNHLAPRRSYLEYLRRLGDLRRMHGLLGRLAGHP